MTLSDLIQTLTLVVAAFSIWWQLKKANEDRENGTYDSLDVRFMSFLEACSKYPELEVYNPLRNNWSELDAAGKRRQLILYQMLVSIFERAYILYNDVHTLKSKSRSDQWDGWVNYMNYYASHPTFRYAWTVEQIGADMDKSFLVFMNDAVNRRNAAQ